ncbi:hypothetical protein ACFORL_10530 [Legionella dresdenensis]|uniref:Uncharacterized protein n=1 Tax=Legionella dresdenensis TaxID=450200 RepID=A0ABV8CHP5_9GAMM
MPKTIIMLGTGTALTRKPNKFYPKGELFSQIPGFLKSTPIEEDDDINSEDHLKQKVEPYISDTLTIIKGPDTGAFEVGDRIARGVRHALEAISKGEIPINIMGHSRGGVEAILIAHELKRIKEGFAQLAAQRSIQEKLLGKEVAEKFEKAGRKQLFGNTPYSYIKTAFDLQKADFAGLDIEGIGKHIKNARVNLQVLDPVPGGSLLGLRLARWYPDPRFYIIPDIVEDFEIYVKENEHSRCFKAIIPLPESPEKTRFNLSTLPGHHGTGSGNFNDQQGNPLPTHLKDKKTDGVQKFLLLKIIDFLKRHNSEFKAIDDVKLANDELTALVKSALEKGTDTLKLEVCNEIANNIEGYQYFDNTSYQWLGQEQSIQSFFWAREVDRIVHYGKHTDSKLRQIIPPIAGKKLINREHAELMLLNKFKFKADTSVDRQPEEAIKSFTNQLIAACKDQYAKSNTENLAASLGQNQLKGLLTDPSGPELINTVLGMIIDQLSQDYLQGKLSHKQALLTAIEESFNNFRQTEANKEADPNQLRQFRQTLEHGLKNTITNQLTNLTTNTDALCQKLQVTSQDIISSFSKSLAEFFTQKPDSEQLERFLKKLNEQIKVLQDKQPDKLFVDIFKFLDAISLDAKDEENLKTQQTILSNLGFDPAIANDLCLDDQDKTALVQELQQLCVETELALDEITEQRPLEKIGNTFDLFVQLSEYEQALNDFPRVIPDLPYNEIRNDTLARKQLLLNQTAEYLVSQAIRLEQFASDMHRMVSANSATADQVTKDYLLDFAKCFIKHVSALAVIKGATDPVHEKLKNEIAALKQQFEELSNKDKRSEQLLADNTAAINKLTAELAEARKTNTQQQSRLEQEVRKQEEQLAVIEKNRTEIEALKTTINDYSNTVKTQQQKIQQNNTASTEQIEKLNARITALETQLREQQLQNQQLGNQQHKLQLEHDALQQQHQTLRQQHSALQEKNLNTEQNLSTLKEQYTELQSAENQQKETNADLNARLSAQQLQNQQLNSQQQKLQQEYGALQQQHDNLRQQHSALQEQNQNTEQNLSTLKEQYTELQSAESQQKETNADLNARLNTQQLQNQQLNSQQQNLQQAYSALQQTYDDLKLQYTRLQEQHADLETAQNQLISEHNAQTENLTTQIQTYEAQITALKHAAAQNQQTIADLQQQQTTTAQELNSTRQTNQSQESLLQQVQAQNVALQNTNNQYLDKIAAIKKQLQDPKQAIALQLIHEKLQPETESYFIHLVGEAKKLFPAIKNINTEKMAFQDLKARVNDYCANLPTDLTNPQQKVIDKIKVVASLHNCLIDDAAEYLPAKRARKFYTQLDNSNGTLRKHRDPMWQRYLWNTIAVATVIPGLLLGLYSLAVKRHSTATFWQSEGEQFIEQVKGEKQNLVSPVK